MKNRIKFNNLLLRRGRLFAFLSLLALIVFAAPNSYAHPSPDTIVLLEVKPDRVLMELQIPLSELELAFGYDVPENSEILIEKLSPQLTDYLRAHVRPTSGKDQFWSVAVTDLKTGSSEQNHSGAFQNLTAHLVLTPPTGVNTRQFNLNYDVVMHQVVNHSAFVSVRNDWELGNIGGQPESVGVIFVDTGTSKIAPLEINLERGSSWNGFKAMVALGMKHIKEGTDHLLFLLVLLLPATLLVSGKHWANFGGAKYSTLRLLKIVAAFTVGHSITLLVGALNWFQIPQQPIEVLIAVSILISAAHAVRPIFPGREMYVAAGFGLIHGLAFASVLAELDLGAGQMALSILGFNVGIELMQIFVIALVVPWLILLSLTSFYKWFRIAGATLAAIAAVFWIAERVSGNPNAVGDALKNISEYAHFGILTLAFIALLVFGFQYNKNKIPSAPTEG